MTIARSKSDAGLRRFLLGAVVLLMASQIAATGRFVFGRLPDDREVFATRLTNARGFEVTVLDLGGIVQSLRVPSGGGETVDVVLGFDDVAGYLNGPRYIGSYVGRFANRIGGSRFELGGREVTVDANEGPNQLHGGPEGFDRRLFSGRAFDGKEGSAVELSLVSPDGDQGYPGTLTLRVTYTLVDDGLKIESAATTDALTLFSPTHHSYFNLAGFGNIRRHLLRIDAQRHTPTDEAMIPIGDQRPVEGTPLDFRKPRAVGDGLGSPTLSHTRGYDHNFVLDGEGLREVAALEDPDSGRRLTVETDRPGLQLYTANGFDGTLRGKSGAAYGAQAGLCLETQIWPDAPNKEGFPSAELRPGDFFRSTTIYRFTSQPRAGAGAPRVGT